MKLKPYREELVQSIKDVGQELIDRAESVIGTEMDAITGFEIHISICPQTDVVCYPEIRFETSVLNKRILKRWQGNGE